MAKIFMILSVVSLAVVLGNAAPQFFTFAQQPVTLIAAAPAPPRVVVKAVPAPAAEPEDTYPQYSFSYKVDDAENADHKEHSETRDGDVVTGKYSLIEPDGTLRTVTYTADAVNGFRAVVDRTPPKITVQRILV